jgi:hypothetical protein
MDALPSRTKESLPQRGEPRLASCDVCGHRHACYVAERPDPNQAGSSAWSSFHVCLG